MKRLHIVFLSILLLLGVGALAFVLWAQHAREAEPAAYSAAFANQSVAIEKRGGFITIRPRSSQPAIGLLFYPGLRVAPEAYVGKLAAIAAAANIQIVIGRPHLNVAAFSINQADVMRGVLPGVTRWYVGGHSLGGAMACLYASKNKSRVEGVVLFGTYCGSDISKTKLRVLDVTGENDGVLPPAKIFQARGELPPSAVIAEIPGMNHAQFGNYGLQPGDYAASINDDTATHKLIGTLQTFFAAPAA